MKKLLAVGLLIGITGLVLAAPAHAQKVKKDMLEKSHWHVAPREYQIIDDRPIIRDFREAPSDPGTIDLPPGPMAGGGSGGGSGAGALAGGAGSPVPNGGLLGDPRHQGFRQADPGLRSLPNAGFTPGGQNSNMRSLKSPAKGLANANSTNLLNGKMLTKPQGIGAGAGASKGMSPSTGRSSGNYGGPPVSSYSGGYGSGSGSGYGGSASRTESNVRGTLLRSK